MIRRRLVFFLLIGGAFASSLAAADLKTRLFLSADAPLLLNSAALASPAAMTSSGFELTAPEVLVPREAEKSRGRAFFLSLLLPGLGERYAGARTKATIFMSTEVALWLGYISFHTYGQWREADYRAFASSYAGVTLAGKPHGYFIDIGNYISLEEYNEAMLRDRNLPEVYLDPLTYYWRWPDEGYRLRYLKLRVSADNASQRAMLTLGAIFANHLISAIDAMWSVLRYNKQLERSGIDLDLRLGMNAGGHTISLTARKSF